MSIPDLLIAAVAERAGLCVLHYDRDYDLIASVTGQDVEWGRAGGLGALIPARVISDACAVTQLARRSADREHMTNRRWIVAVLAVVGCGTKRVNVCSSDADCMDPGYPFCDVNGEYPASGGEKNVCTTVPDNCPVDRCGCTANAVLSCVGDQLMTCGADGKSSVTSTCALGCAADGTRCLTFEPSNGLGGALTMAAGEGDVTIPAGAKIDTDLGTVVDGNGVPVAVRSVQVAQTGAPTIRAFIAHSLVVNNVTVHGANALAFVATEKVTLQGVVNAAGRASTNGPGSEASPFTCAGMTAQQYVCTAGASMNTITPGGGGGGDAVMGGNTGGGSPVVGFMPLYGGCRGGDLQNSSGATLGMGGGGGGAVEVVSLSAIVFTSDGFIDVGGGGGNSSCGGGSGGVVILEAPDVQLSGSSTGITANGGAGGGCGGNGADATMTTSPAPAPTCTSGGYSAGAGGTEMTAPGSSAYCVPGGGIFCVPCDGTPYGGGGGAVGRLRVATKDGTYALLGAPVLSVAVSAAVLVAK